MRLAGTEKWSEDRVDAALAFSANLASSGAAIRRLLAERPRRAHRDVEGPPDPTDIPYKRGEAAALAFATGRISSGLAIAGALFEPQARLTMMQRIFTATLGAIAGTVAVQMRGEGLVIAAYEGQGHLLVSLGQHTLVERRRLADLAIPAAYASLQLRTKIGGLPDDGFAQASRFGVKDPFTRYSLFGQAVQGAEQAPNLVPIVLIGRFLEYETYIGMLQSSQKSWARLEFRGPLIDWPLLAMLVGVHRAQQMPEDSDFALGPGTQFLQSLARAIARAPRAEV